MDDYSDKRTANGLAISRKSSGLVFRETAKDQNTKFCNRIGCSGSRLNNNRGMNVDKAKSVRSSFRPSTNGKETAGSSSRSFAAISNPRKPLLERQKKLASHIETDSSENGSVVDEPEVQVSVAPPGETEQDIHPESQGDCPAGITVTEAGGSGVTSSTRFHRNFHQKSVLGNSHVLTGSPVSLPSTSMNQGRRLNSSKYGLRNIRCNTKSDVVTSGFSSSESNVRKSKNSVKKRICDGEGSSSFRGKKISGSTLQGQNSSSSSGIFISESRCLRSGPAIRDAGASSARSLRSANGYQSPGIGTRGGGNNSSPNDSHSVIPQLSRPDMAHETKPSSSSRQFSGESSSGRPISYSRPGSGSGRLRSIRPSSPAEMGVTTRSLLNLESFRQYNMDGIAEVLLALDRIEQDEELTFEQLMVLETNLFLTGFSFIDQHRDMRLDIDDMTYEELLALGDRMGTVSTALTEAELSECLNTYIYQSEAQEDSVTNLDGDEDDVKCSICQEEYVNGDEVGRLHCEHRYHVACINQWLRMKNWCAICKASAASSSSSLPLSSTFS